MNLNFLIDECLHRRLVGVAKARGHEAEHVLGLGLGAAADGIVAGAAVGREAILLTNNRRDFRRIYRRFPRHPGLAVIIPNVALGSQVSLFDRVLDFLETSDPRNSILEITGSGDLLFAVWCESSDET